MMATALSPYSRDWGARYRTFSPGYAAARFVWAAAAGIGLGLLVRRGDTGYKPSRRSPNPDHKFFVTYSIAYLPAETSAWLRPATVAAGTFSAGTFALDDP